MVLKRPDIRLSDEIVSSLKNNKLYQNGEIPLAKEMIALVEVGSLT